jgi:hypothetical protein
MAATSSPAHKTAPPAAGSKPKCPECGKAWHHSSSTCSRARKPKVTGHKVAGDLAPKRKQLTKGEQLARQVGVVLWLGQQAVFTARPDWVDDQLSPEEFRDLSEAIADELMSWDFLMRWIAQVAGAAVHIRLGIVVLGIAVPRLVKHGVIPPQVAMGMMMAAAEAEAGVPDSNGATPPVEVAHDPVERATLFEQLEVEAGGA